MSSLPQQEGLSKASEGVFDAAKKFFSQNSDYCKELFRSLSELSESFQPILPKLICRCEKNGKQWLDISPVALYNLSCQTTHKM